MSNIPSVCVDHAAMANAVRFLAIDAVEKAQAGHPGMPLGMADVATVLFSRFLSFDPTMSYWPNRDRFVLSAGHGSMLLYAIYYLTGFPDVDIAAIKNFRQIGSTTPGHPEFKTTLGVDITTGPLGQGLANSVGMALAERMLNARFGDDIVDHRTYVIASDGDLMEGISHEAASLAGHLNLDRLTVLWDDNRISIDGPTNLTISDDTCKRFQAYGWMTQSIDGHDPQAIAHALERAQQEKRPSLIACRTIIGYGTPTKAGTEKCHGSPLGKEEISQARERLGWPYPEFEIPAEIMAAWHAVGERGQVRRHSWEQALMADETKRQQFNQVISGDLVQDWDQPIKTLKQQWLNCQLNGQLRMATRKASQEILKALTSTVTTLVGGSADLSNSNLTRTSGMVSVTKDSYHGQYIFYGVREFCMAAVMNGFAVHGGFIPYGGTFLVFSDYMRSAIRLSALMGLQVIYVFTHDSIGVGEDGPTHQPIEHLAMLRATPNLVVYRPADAIETAECWTMACSDRHHPSALILGRQEVESIEHMGEENKCAFGGYVVCDTTKKQEVTLIASGSEVAIAQKVRVLLEAAEIGTVVVSMPSWEIFDRQPLWFRQSVLGEGCLRVAIEAASPLGWERYVGLDGLIIGLDDYGLSGPGETLFEHFGFTSEKIVQKIIDKKKSINHEESVITKKIKKESRPVTSSPSSMPCEANVIRAAKR